MPHSYHDGKSYIADWMTQHFPTSAKILDIGPGVGTYADLLTPLGYTLDAIEICPEYVTAYHLRDKYQTVWIGDGRQAPVESYDVVILGDVLEHLTVSDAQSLLARCQTVLVAVPYHCPQPGVTFDVGDVTINNPHEEHRQPDLNPVVMAIRYPALGLIWSNHWYGYYSNWRWINYSLGWIQFPITAP